VYTPVYLRSTICIGRKYRYRIIYEVIIHIDATSARDRTETATAVYTYIVLYKNPLPVHVHRVYWYNYRVSVNIVMRPPPAPPASSAAIPTAVTAAHPDCTGDDRKPQQHHLNTAVATTMVTWSGCRGRAERHTATKSRRTVTYRWRPWPYGALPRRSYRCPTSTSSSATGSRITGKTLKGQ